MLRRTPLKVLTNPEPPGGQDALKTAAGCSYTISWSFADQQYAARCSDFPGAASLGTTRESALERAKQKVSRILGE